MIRATSKEKGSYKETTKNTQIKYKSTTRKAQILFAVSSWNTGGLQEACKYEFPSELYGNLKYIANHICSFLVIHKGIARTLQAHFIIKLTFTPGT